MLRIYRAAFDTQLVPSGFVGNEIDVLHLTDIVESDNMDEGGRVSLLSLFHLIHNLDGVSVFVRGQFPRGLITTILISWRFAVYKSMLQKKIQLVILSIISFLFSNYNAICYMYNYFYVCK